mgnify:CR=1 FL=1
MEQRVVQAQIPKTFVEDHLRLDKAVDRFVESAKAVIKARSEQGKVMRRILREKGLTKEFRKIQKELRGYRVSDIIFSNSKKLRQLYKRKIEILKEVRDEKDYQVAHQALLEAQRAKRDSEKTLIKEYELSIKPKYQHLYQ